MARIINSRKFVSRLRTAMAFPCGSVELELRTGDSGGVSAGDFTMKPPKPDGGVR
jgi:hypothetical protein